MTIKMVLCPTCGNQVEWNTNNTYRPFCSLRCKNIDLGAWANEDYVLTSQDEPLSDDIQNSLN